MRRVRYLIDFATEKNPEVWWYDGMRVMFRAASTSVILHTMRYDDRMSQAELAEHAGVSASAVSRQVAQLTAKGYIRQTEEGRWHVLVCPSVDLNR